MWKVAGNRRECGNRSGICRSRRGLVATLCEHCGQTLPRDDTQFCNHCGQFVKPSTARPASAKPTSNGAASWSASREQASTPPAEKNEGRANVPPWLSKLDKEIEGERIAISSPQARNPIRAARATSSPQAENPAKAATALKSAESMRELRVKVWEDQDGISEPEEPPRESTRREVQEKSGKGEPAADGEVDALPTAPLNTTSIADLPTMSPVQAIRRPNRKDTPEESLWMLILICLLVHWLPARLKRCISHRVWDIRSRSMKILSSLKPAQYRGSGLFHLRGLPLPW